MAPIEDRCTRSRTVASVRSVTTRVLSLVAALGFIVLALMPNGATQIYQWPWSLGTSLLATAPVVLLFLIGFGRKTSLGGRANLVVGLLAATLVLSGLTSRFATQSLDAALIGLGMLATIFCSASYLTTGESDDRAGKLLKWIGWFGVIFSLISLYGWVMGTLRWEALKVAEINWNVGANVIEWNAFNYRNESPLGHGNYTAGLTLLLIPWMIGLALSQRRWKRVFWSVATLLVGFVLFTAGSRGALLGVATAVAGLLALLALRRTIQPKHLISLGLVGLLGVIALSLSQPRVRQLIHDFGQSRELNAGDQQRWSMLEAGLRMGADHPLIGQGPGVTPLTYPGYRAELAGGVESALQLHSTPLQIWADLGTVGLILSLVLILIAGYRLWRRPWTAPTGNKASIQSIALGSAVISTSAYLAFALTDFQLDVPVFAGFLAINLGVILGSTRPEERARSPGSIFSVRALRMTAVLATILLTMPVLWSVGQETLARRAHSAAVDQLERGDWIGFENGIQDAMRWSPRNAFYPVSGALGMLRIAYQTTDPEKAPLLEERAIGYFRQSLAINDDQEIAHFNLGWLLLESDPASAEQHFRRAAALVPNKGGVYLGRGLACFEQDIPEGTVSGFALEMVNDPSFALAPFWDIPIFRAFRPAVMEKAISMLEHASVAAETGSASNPNRYHQTATILRDLSSDAPPSDLLTLRSSRAMAVAGLNPEARHSTINAQLVQGRRGMVNTESIQIYLDLFARNGADPKAILNDPAGREDPLIRQVRRERPGYGILMRNLDVPLPVDAYIVQENGIVRDFFPSLFPPKGYLSAPDMVRLAEAGYEGGSS